MERKQVWRYYCAHCKYARCSKPTVEKHEKGCTTNPDRVCGMCPMVDAEQKPIEELLALLPDHAEYREDDLVELRKATRNCPACMLAAIRQRGGVTAAFNWKQEATDVLEAWNKKHPRHG